MKKTLKITGISFLVLLVLLILSPFLFKNKIEALVQQTINEHAPVEVYWKKLDISLIKSFPKSRISLKDFSVINKGVFAGDTLASGKNFNLELGIMQLLKGQKPIQIDAFSLDRGFIQIKIDSLGRANYDFSDESTETNSSDEPMDFSLSLSKYDLKDSRIYYTDASSGISLKLDEFNHIGTGDFSLAQSELDTRTKTKASFAMGGTEYLSNHILSLDALIGMDLDEMKFSFLENEAKVNELPLTFEGFVQLFDDYNEVDIQFQTPSSDFKNFLAVIPKEYLQHLDGVNTTGNFEVKGDISGKVDDTYIPKMNIQIKSANASFSYPDLPKSMQDIYIDVALKNNTGLMKDMLLNIGDLKFRIENNPFAVRGSVANFMENALVDLDMKGRLNLGELKEVMPLEADLNLEGIFDADLKMKFDMLSVEREQYDRIDSRGKASLSDFIYKGDAFKNDFNIATAEIDFNPSSIKLLAFDAQTGQTDLKATGNIDNLIQFVMKGQELKGQFEVLANRFVLSDFMSDEEENSSSNTNQETSSEMKIPAFLNAVLNFDAKEVHYDNLILKNLKGRAGIADETASIQHMQSDLLGGLIALSGNVSTKSDVPSFNMNIGLEKVHLEETFKNIGIVKFLAPIFSSLEGVLDTEFNLAGDLTSDFSPKLETLKGSALLHLITANVHPESNKLTAMLNEKLQFANFSDLSLNDLSTKLQFDNGEISMQPLNYQYKDMNFEFEGKHSLTNEMNYTASIDLPAKYLGGDVNKILAKLSPEEAEEQHVKLPIRITGNGSKPNVQVDMKAAIESLTASIIDYQKGRITDKVDDAKQELEDKIDEKKQELEDKIEDKIDEKKQELEDKLKDKLGDIIPGRQNSDSTETDKKGDTKDKLKEGLKDLFKRK